MPAEVTDPSATPSWWSSGASTIMRLASGPFVFVVLILMPRPDGLEPAAWTAVAVAGWMATWWILEAIPIYATALLPVVLFPLLGALDARATASSYAEPTVFLFLGGFMLAAAMQRWGLHRRMALATMAAFGSSPPRLLLGVMVATAFISMWVSNTATVLMVFPIALALIQHLEERGAGSRGFAVALMLGVAYAGTVGGVATLIGTPPNALLAGQAAILYPDRTPITFASWLPIGLAFTIVFLPVVWLMLRLMHLRGHAPVDMGEAVAKERAGLGRLRREEVVVLVVFGLVVLGWVFRADLDLGAFIVPGWSSGLGVAASVHDATVAVAGALLLMLLPVRLSPRTFVLDWETAVRIPWGVLILFGGGFALAQAFEATGVTPWLGQRLAGLGALPAPVLVLLVALLASFASELISNTALSAILIPVAGALADALGLHPYLLMIPAAIGASAAFMMPVGTPPNAIVFGSGRLRVLDMARAGFLLNLVGALVVLAVVYLVAVPLLGL